MKTKKVNAYEITKKWREENPEKFREQWLRRYKNNAEKIKAKKRERYQQLKKEKSENIQN